MNFPFSLTRKNYIWYKDSYESDLFIDGEKLIEENMLSNIDFISDPLGKGDFDEYCANMAAKYLLVLYLEFYKGNECSLSFEKIMSDLDPVIDSFIQRKLLKYKSLDELIIAAEKVAEKIIEVSHLQYHPTDVCIGSLLFGEFTTSSGGYNDVTPSYLTELSSKILNIRSGEKVADFCCGKGRSLATLWCNEPDALYYGFENNPDYAAIAKMRLELLHGNEVFNKSVFDFTENEKQTLKFDKIFSDIPLLSKEEIGLKNESGRADWVIYSLITEHLNKGGKAVSLATSSTLGDVKLYRGLREKLVEQKYVEAVIELNSDLGEWPVQRYDKQFLIIWSKKINNQIKFIDATDIFTKYKGYTDTVLTDEDIEKIYELYCADESNAFVEIVPIETVCKNNYSLLPGKYFSRIRLMDYEVAAQERAIRKIKQVKFGDMIEMIKRGTAMSSEELIGIKSERPTHDKLLMISDVQDGVDIGQLDSLTNIPKGQDKYCVPPWSEYLVISKNGSPIKTAVVETEENTVLVSGNFYIIKLKDGYDPWCVAAFFAAYQSVLDRAARGDKLKTLYMDDIKNIELIVTPKNKQKEIGEKFRSALHEIDRLKRSLGKIFNDG